MSNTSRSTSSEPTGTGPTEEARAEFGRLAPPEELTVVSEALERNGVTSFVVDSGVEAKRAVL
jgi:hypothetical protein